MRKISTDLIIIQPVPNQKLLTHFEPDILGFYLVLLASNLFQANADLNRFWLLLLDQLDNLSQR